MQKSVRVFGIGALYFALVFGAGFILGPIRVLYLVPAVGEFYAELIEMPIMLGVIVAAALFIARRFAATPGERRDSLLIGTIALACMLLAEFGLIVPLRGLSLTEYFEHRDPVLATLYYASLFFFAIAPALFARYDGRR